MQKLIYSALVCAFLASCGGASDEKKEPETFEEKKQAVCDCVKENEGKDRMECAKMQSELADTFEDEEEAKKFRLESSECF